MALSPSLKAQNAALLKCSPRHCIYLTSSLCDIGRGSGSYGTPHRSFSKLGSMFFEIRFLVCSGLPWITWQQCNDMLVNEVRWPIQKFQQ